MFIRTLSFIGINGLHISNAVGDFIFFLLRTMKTMFTTRLKMKQLFMHMERIGVGSVSIVFLTGASTGLALALQTYIGLSRFGGENYIGVVVALGMARELGPVLTGLMVTGRVGSAMTAELGTMQITEQIDALRTLRINPFQYLIVPRLVASTLIMPFLAIFSMLCGTIGGYLYTVYVLEMGPDVYLSSIRAHVVLSDIAGGLVKSGVFGFILAWVGSYKGYMTTGGAKGVGLSTTQSVVIGSIMILIANYFLSSLLFKSGLSA